MDWINIGRRIRKQREHLGLTREALAEKLDVTPKFCSDIEFGIKGMSISTLCHMSQVLMLSTDYILFGEKEIEDNSPAMELLRQCPKEKLYCLENIIVAYLSAIKKE